MPENVRRLIIMCCLLAPAAAIGAETYYKDVSDVVPNRLTDETSTKADGGGLFYVTGLADPQIRVEVQIGYNSVNPDFEVCGGRSYGWPKPISLYRRYIFRPTREHYGLLLNRAYENEADPKSKKCRWRMTDLVVRAYRRTEGDLLGKVVFIRANQARAYTDPRPTPRQLTLTCSREPAPPQNWKPRCSYAPFGSVYSHFILGSDHSRLEHAADGSYVVKTPLEINFRLAGKSGI